MKKQIVSLLLGAAIFTTHPACSMEPEEEGGILCRQAPEVKIAVFNQMDEKDISSFMCVSKGYYDLIENHSSMIKLKVIYRNKVLCRKEDYKDAEFSMYMGTDKRDLGNVFLSSDLGESKMYPGLRTTIDEKKAERLFIFLK